MKSTALECTISFSDALHIFWDWRQASISVEVSFFGKSRASETVRVSIDGLVTLVDPEGVVTISGDGREIELDLRGCEFARAGKASGSTEPFDPLDPDSVLQMNFSHGEVCLIFPYRRVARLPGGQRRAAEGIDWLRGKLASATGTDVASNAGLKLQTLSSLGSEAGNVKRTGKHGLGPAVFPLLGLLLAFTVVALALTPVRMPRLLSELGLGHSSLSNPESPVWVIRREGNYYCRGGVLFGRMPGQIMMQGDALALGYQPALGNYCGGAGQHAPRIERHGVAARIRNAFRNGRLILSIVLSRSRSWFASSYPPASGGSLSASGL